MTKVDKECKRYRVNLDLYIEAEDTTEVEHVILGMADCFDYNNAYFRHRSAIAEIPEDSCDASLIG